MKNLVNAVFGIFLIVAFFDLCWAANSSAGDAKKANPTPESLIETHAPVRRDFTLTCPWFGRVESKETIRVRALTDGEVLAVKVPDETPVIRGTLLFTLGGPRVESRLKSLMTKVTFLKREISLARETVVMEKMGVSYQLTKKPSLILAKTRLAALQGALAQTEGALASLRRRLVIRARMDGLFTKRRVSKGQEIHEGDILCEIVPLKSLRIVATLFPPQGTHLKGFKAIIHTLNGQTVTATATTVLPRHTRKGATIIWIEDGAVNRKFSPGETVSGKLVIGVQRGLIAVPVSAIIRDQNERPFVFIKGPKGYIKRPVKTGPVFDGWVGILNGIRETDRVVIHGGYELFYRHFNKIYKVAD